MELSEMTLVDVQERLTELETEVREAQDIDVVERQPKRREAF